MRTPEEQLVDASLDMGKALLLAGGEVTRVEDTITRILHAYGMHKVGVFTITSLIEVTARTPDGDEIVKARRIAGGYATNLDRVEQLNALSREICATCPPPQDITARVEAIKYPKPEAAWISYVGAMLAAGSFTVFFGGKLADVPATIILACFINWMDRKGIYKKENQLLFYLVCSIVTGFLGCVLVRVGIGVDLDKILIGCIMLTIPGIPLPTRCGICCWARASQVCFGLWNPCSLRPALRAASCLRPSLQRGCCDGADISWCAGRPRLLHCLRRAQKVHGAHRPQRWLVVGRLSGSECAGRGLCRQHGVGHVLQPNGRSSGPAHQGSHRRAPDARHCAHDSRWQPLLHDALCLLGRYAQCQALFSLYYPRYLRYGYRLCCGECPAQDAGRKA